MQYTGFPPYLALADNVAFTLGLGRNLRISASAVAVAMRIIFVKVCALPIVVASRVVTYLVRVREVVEAGRSDHGECARIKASVQFSADGKGTAVI